MKKTYLGLFAAGLVMSLASCTSDALESSGPESDLTTFTIQLPAEMQTRTFGDGRSALGLAYAVYKVDAQGDNPELVTNVDTWFADGDEALNGKTVSLRLVKGNYYKVAFAAKAIVNASVDPYSFDAQNMTLNIDYSKIGKCSNENLDAFYTVVPTGKVAGGQNLTAELKRPTAQINWGTDDLDPTNDCLKGIAFDATGASILETQVVAKNLPDKLNIMDGTVTGSQDVTFTMAPIPASTETFPYQSTKYKYVAMNYILVGKDPSTIDLELTFKNVTSPVTVSQCPVQRNYQTNIYGSLLTSPFEYTVKITPAFGGNNNHQVVDVDPGKANVNGQVYDTPNAALASLSGQTEGTVYIGETKTGNDIAVRGLSVPTSVKDITFEGSGNGTVLEITAIGGNQPLPWQPNIDEITFKNLTLKFDHNIWHNGVQNKTKVTFENCTIEGVLATYTPNTVFTNCKFSNTGAEYCLVIYGGNEATLDNCTFNQKNKAALNVYQESRSSDFNLTVNNCTFDRTNDGKTNKDKPAPIMVRDDALTNGAAYNIKITNMTQANVGTGYYEAIVATKEDNVAGLGEHLNVWINGEQKTSNPGKQKAIKFTGDWYQYEL